MKLCDYRCGKEAKYQFKNGKWCCNKSWNSCPKRREEHSKIMKDIMNHTEVKTKCSKAAKESWKDLEKRKNRTESINRPKVRRKKRLARIKDMKKKHGQLIPNYNLEGCKIIDEYSKKHKYNFQHAENGGEFYIKELGYWVDGYDKERNVVIEIDEPAHYNINGNLSKQDIERQKEIENHLNCKFIRIKI